MLGFKGQRYVIVFKKLLLILKKIPKGNMKHVYHYKGHIEVCMYVYIHLHIYMHAYIYVTGFWKTERIVTQGLFHFIVPANGYTCTLHLHSAITRLGAFLERVFPTL